MKVIRNDLSLGQMDAAKRFGVGISTWQRFEAGAGIKDDVLRALAEEGYNINWLLTGEGPMRRSEIEGIPADIAEAAAVGLAASYRTLPHKLSKESLLMNYRDFCRGFTEAAETED